MIIHIIDDRGKVNLNPSYFCESSIVLNHTYYHD